MSDLLVNLNVNKITENNPGMGNSFGKYSGQTDINSHTNIKDDVYEVLRFKKSQNLNTSKLEMDSKENVEDKSFAVVNRKTLLESAISLQASSMKTVTTWTELCWRVKRAYRIAYKDLKNIPLSSELGVDAKLLSEILWRDDWQQLLLKLEALLHEMAMEHRERLRRIATMKGTDHPEDYVKALLHGYKAFRTAGDALAPCLPPQVDKLLSRRFAPVDFRLLNARMFESCVYSDPIIQDSVPAAIGKIAGTDRQLVRSYLDLDEQMTDVASRWLDVKKLLLKLGKGRAQWLEDWKACKELREMALDYKWRVRYKPPPVSLLPDFDVQFLTFADELSTDRNCICSTEDSLPDSPPMSPSEQDRLIDIVNTSNKLLSTVRTWHDPKHIRDILKTQLPYYQKNAQKQNKETSACTAAKVSQPPENKKISKSCTHLPSQLANCDHKQKSVQVKVKEEKEEKCTKIKEKSECDKKKATTCQCECPHGDLVDNSAKQFTKYTKLRERLRTRLKEKQKGGHKHEASTPTENSDDRDITQLLNFIEGNDNTPDPIRAQKNAARKLRRQERKLEAEHQKQEEERQQQEKERLRLEQEAAAKAAEVKAQNARAKKEKAQQQVAEEGNKKGGPMVTIKRVMQGSNKEPTVTITLKGSTPDKDKLLFTLINGQSENNNNQPNVKSDLTQVDTSKLSKKQRKKLKKEQAKNASQPRPAQVPTKKETNTNNEPVKSKTNVNNNSSKSTNNSKESKEIVTNNKVEDNSVKVSLNGKSEGVLNLQMLRLPPGITITKVEGPTTDRKFQLNPKTTPTSNTNSVQTSPSVQSNDNRSGIIVVDTVKLKQDLPPNTEKNTSQRSKKNKKKKNKKIENIEPKQSEKNNEDKNSLSSTNNSEVFTLKNPMFYQVQDANSEAAKQQAANQQASIIKSANGMVTIRSPRLGTCNSGSGIPFMSLQAVAGDLKPSHILSELKPVVQSQPAPTPSFNSNSSDKPFDAQQILSGLPGIEITKINKGSVRPRNDRAAFQPADVSIIPTNMATNGDVYKLFYDNADWSLESVFAPKDIKEDEILDAEELELEAFKRFCQQSVPPEKKEKVAYLNVKDIVLKKKASEKV